MENRTVERPAYVRFEQRAVEDRAQTVALGHYATKDETFVIVTPAGSKDEVVKIASEWLMQVKAQVREGRMPPEWELLYVKAYEHYKRGEDLPLSGTPVKGWMGLSPSQQQMVLAANVRTVEDLAMVNGEGLTRIGMGAQELKQKAEAWLKAAQNVGKVVEENNALKVRMKDLEESVKRMEAQNAALAARLAALAPAPQPAGVTA